MEEGLHAPEVSLEGLQLHAAADAQNLLDPDLAAGHRKASERSRGGSAASGLAFRAAATLPVLQLRRHVQELWAVGGDGLNAAAEGAVLPQAGGHGAPQGHLTHVQDVSD